MMMHGFSGIAAGCSFFAELAALVGTKEALREAFAACFSFVTTRATTMTPTPATMTTMIASEPVAEQPVAEQLVAEQPIAEQLVAEQPIAEQPVAEQPLADLQSCMRYRMAVWNVSR